MPARLGKAISRHRSKEHFLQGKCQHTHSCTPSSHTKVASHTPPQIFERSPESVFKISGYPDRKDMPRKYENCHWGASQPHEACLLSHSLHQGLHLKFYVLGLVSFLPATMDDL